VLDKIIANKVGSLIQSSVWKRSMTTQKAKITL